MFLFCFVFNTGFDIRSTKTLIFIMCNISKMVCNGKILEGTLHLGGEDPTKQHFTV